ncbi:MAG: homocysteine S-methyltransferase family protein [Pseudomonadota bacterium]
MNVTLLDGGMGQELIQRYGEPPTPLWSTHVMMHQPELVGEIHDDYFAAGAEVATTNTYAIHRDRLQRQDPALESQFKDLHKKACDIASQSRDKNGSGLIAGSMGPLGFSYRPDLNFPPEEAAELFAEITKIHEPDVDFHLIETVSSIEHAKGCLMGASVSSKPVWLGITVADNDGTKLRSGEDVADIKSVLKEFAPDALLINCSTPEAVNQAISVISDVEIPFGAYANAFTYITSSFTESETVDQLEARTDLGPEKYAEFCAEWVAQGATVIGGCCEVGPAHIAELKRRFH